MDFMLVDMPFFLNTIGEERHIQLHRSHGITAATGEVPASFPGCEEYNPKLYQSHKGVQHC
ncbi:unnamed protein product [Prunus armeniaca]